MINIILIDPECKLIETIDKMEDINIEVVLVTDYSYRNTKVDINKFNEFYFYRGLNESRDFYNNVNHKKLNLTYDDIEKYRHLQLEVEHLFSRTTGDIGFKQNRYFHSLSYWLNIFKNKKIDYVISTALYHGDLEDMALSIAKSFGVKTLTFESFSHMNNYRFFGVFDWSKKNYISVSQCIESNSKVKKTDIQFTSKKVLYKEKHKSIFHKFLFFTGGYILFLLISKVLRKDNTIYLGSRISFSTYFSSYIFSKSLMRFYNKKTLAKKDDEKYIYFSLHFDPEAQTQARACISSQLTLIKMLSDTVPNDVYIYVKDHPIYTMLNSAKFAYHLPGIKNVRSHEYYNEISKMRNVKLIDINESSEELAKNALAISSITGTIILENIVKYKKPIIMFDSNLSPIGMLKDIFKIKSTNDCSIAISKIYNGFKPLYNDFDEVLENYAFKTDAEAKGYFNENVLRCILKQIDLN